MDTIIHLLLGLVIGYGLRKPIEQHLLKLSSEAPAVQVPDLPHFEPKLKFIPAAFPKFDDGEQYAHPDAVCVLMKKLGINVPPVETTEDGFSSTVTYDNIFNNMAKETLEVEILNTAFTKADTEDDNYNAFVYYLFFAQVWNKLHAGYPKELPHPANEKDCLVKFEELDEYIQRINN